MLLLLVLLLLVVVVVLLLLLVLLLLVVVVVLLLLLLLLLLFSSLACRMAFVLEHEDDCRTADVVAAPGWRRQQRLLRIFALALVVSERSTNIIAWCAWHAQHSPLLFGATTDERTYVRQARSAHRQPRAAVAAGHRRGREQVSAHQQRRGACARPANDPPHPPTQRHTTPHPPTHPTPHAPSTTCAATTATTTTTHHRHHHPLLLSHRLWPQHAAHARMHRRSDTVDIPHI